MKLDMKVIDIVDKAVAGEKLTAEEIGALYALDPFGPEAYYVRWAGRKMSMEAANGIAEIHAQIGLNATPCPHNCQFCSFAACNKLRVDKWEIPKEDVIEYAKIYEDQGANLMLLLATGSYKFEKFLEMGAAVREVISKDMPLLANVDDFTLEQAKALKATGFNGVYHAVRMGEGVFTGIPVEKRLATIANAKEAGLKICTCVEPVGPEHTVEELVAATLRSLEMNPVSSGVGKRITVPGTLMEKYGMLSESHVALYVAIYRLADGYRSALNCSGHSIATAEVGANLAWAEMGTNPRDVTRKTEQGGLGHDIPSLKRMFAKAEWQVREGASPHWK